MRKEQTELFSNNPEEIPQEEIHFNRLTIHQQIDPLEILLEEMIIRKKLYPYWEHWKSRKINN